MKADVILGLQWGDEGKGKIVDALAPEYDIIARFQGGPNAGHTIIFNDRKFVLHSVPSGIFRQEIINYIGNGVVLDPLVFKREIDMICEAGFDPLQNLIISKNAHLILPSHRLLDAASEAAMGDGRIGSTLKGIGPAYTDKYARRGIRAGQLTLSSFLSEYALRKENHLKAVEALKVDVASFRFDGLGFEEYEIAWLEAAKEMTRFRIHATEIEINRALSAGKRVLAEGAQGTLLDVDFGSYPFVTSSNTMAGGVCTGLGIPPQRIGRVFGIFKAYCTRVGNGPFPTELENEMGELIRKNGNEFGSTTGRPRRTGWLDLPALRYAVMINGVTDLVMTKADVLSGLETIELCHAYKDAGKSFEMPGECDPLLSETELIEMKGWSGILHQATAFDAFPEGFRDYVKFIGESIGVPVTIVSTGPERNQLIKI